MPVRRNFANDAERDTYVLGLLDTLVDAPGTTHVHDALEAHPGEVGTHGAAVALVGTTDPQTLTNKTISGAANTLSGIPQTAVTNLPADLAARVTASQANRREHVASYSGTTDASANLVVTHGAGFTPTQVFLQSTAPSGGGNQGYPVVTAITATTFTVRYLATLGATTNLAVAGYFRCFG